MRWTEAEVRRLVEMKNRGMSWREIGKALNRNYHSVSSKWVDMHSHGSGNSRQVLSVHVPECVIAEREKRLNAPRTINALILGDPPIGFSALEGRR